MRERETYLYIFYTFFWNTHLFLFIYLFFLYLHFPTQINPPHYIPLVEVVPAPWTDPSIVAQTRSILSGIGQAPVVLNKEVDGFLVNRLQYALLMEAYRLVEVSGIVC